MSAVLLQFVTPLLVVAAGAYAVLAVRIARSGPQHENSLVSVSLILIAGMIAGSAFSYNATDASMYGIGRVLSFGCSGFLPVVFYAIYRNYAVGPPRALVIAILSAVPLVTLALALTNSFHGLVWMASETPSQLSVSAPSDHLWYSRVFAPATYGLFAYSAVALFGRLPTIASAHRKVITIMLIGAVLPFIVSITNNIFGIGPSAFPFTSLTASMLWPLFAYAAVELRVHEISPVAYQTLFNHVRDPILVVDMEQRIVCANKAAQDLLQGDENSLLGRKLWEEFPAARAILEQARELDLTQTLRMDSSKVYEVSVAPLSGRNGKSAGMVVVCRDVTERRQAQARLADSEHLIRTLIETSSNGILRFARGTIDRAESFECVFANRSAQCFAGDEGESLVGKPLSEFGLFNAEKLQQHFAADSPATTQVSYEVALHDSAAVSWLRIVGEPVGEDFSITLVDITQRKQNEDQMMAEALRDPLTGVLNRRGFEQQGAACLKQCTRGAVLYLDLDGFKTINDRFGHQAGDALLKAFGHRLEFCLRPEDILGRMGGDEFAIVLPDVDIEDARHIAQRLVQTASDAYIIQGEELSCTASVGIALMPKHGNELWHLLSIADQAMYRVKRIPAEEAANDRAAYVEAATAS